MDYSGSEFQEQISFSTLALLWQVFLLMFFVDTFFAGAILAYLRINPPEAYGNSFISLLWILHTLKFIIITYLVLRAIAVWAERRVYITSHHIIAIRGILKKKEELYDLHQLRSVSMRQGWIARRLNYGSLHCVFTASGYTQELNLLHIYNPSYYEAIIGRHLGEEQ